MARKTETRDREILSRYENGLPRLQLAIRYGLAEVTIQSIISAEKHRLQVSPDEYYVLRRSGATALTYSLGINHPASSGNSV